MNRALIVYSVDNSINGCLSRKDRCVMVPSSGGVGKDGACNKIVLHVIIPAAGHE